MSHVLHREVTTRWAPEAVFDYLVDFSHAEEWDSGTVRCERLSGDGGVGTRYRNVSRFLGRETTLEVVRRTAETVFIPGGRSRWSAATGR